MYIYIYMCISSPTLESELTRVKVMAFAAAAKHRKPRVGYTCVCLGFDA